MTSPSLKSQGDEIADEEFKPKEQGDEIADEESTPKESRGEIADEESKPKELNSGGKMRRLLGG